MSTIEIEYDGQRATLTDSPLGSFLDLWKCDDPDVKREIEVVHERCKNAREIRYPGRYDREWAVDTGRIVATKLGAKIIREDHSLPEMPDPSLFEPGGET